MSHSAEEKSIPQNPSEEIDVEKRLSGFTEHSASASSPITEFSGVIHQNELGAKMKRRHFFSPLDLKHAQALNLDAEQVQYTREEEV